ncbi:MAG: DUF1549 domain-containing protein [Pirellulaceae bacterium]
MQHAFAVPDLPPGASSGRLASLRGWIALVALLAALCSTFSLWADESTRPLIFETDIAPLFAARCTRCHGGEKLEAGLDLRRRFLIEQGGDSGAAIVRGRPDDSVLIQRIEADEMPPPEEGRLDAKQKQLLRNWVAGGAGTRAASEPPLDESETASRISAADRDFWSFRPPARAPLPSVATDAGRPAVCRNPIDAFLLEGLAAAGLSFNAEAPRPVLLRRLCFDLWGLPPTPEQLDEFLADAAPDAYERLVDRLLAGPEYGERWGRHWLDVAGYADSDGYLAADRIRPEAWRYRDWVIQALNRDLPYDTFVTYQVAGDELTSWRKDEEISPDVYDQLVATGFLRTSLDPTYPGYTEPNEIHQVMADTLQIVSSTFLGLTVQCARCHAHKFDPVSQRDYYSLQAIFLGGMDPARWQPSEVRGIPLATEIEEARIQKHNAQVDERVKALNESLAELTSRYRRKRLREAWDERARGLPADRALPALDAKLLDQLAAALVTPQAKRSADQKQQIARYSLDISLTDADLAQRYPAFQEDLAALKAALAAEQALKKPLIRLRGFMDLDEQPPAARILRRGDYNQPGGEVAPGIPGVLAAEDFQFSAEPGYKTSGRRRAFARWLMQEDHPLVARVHVNRIWAAHFGRPLVATPANLGRSGAKPSHPGLLDWLAVEFQRSEYVPASRWSQKDLHRLIVTSAAYRQSADMSTLHAEADPENRLYGAWTPKRHEGEMVRDSLLAVSGRLNRQPFGKWSNVLAQPDGSVIDTDDGPGRRRAIYQIVRRSQHLTMLELFDTPLMEVNCPERTVSTVPLQALAMLHGPTVERAANALGDRIWQVANSDEERIHYAYRLLFCREPSPAETSRIEQALAALHLGVGEHKLSDSTAAPDSAEVDESARRAAWRQVALVLLNSNEFLYVH